MCSYPIAAEDDVKKWERSYLMLSSAHKVCPNCLCLPILLSYVETFRSKSCAFIHGTGTLTFDNYFESFYCAGTGINSSLAKEVRGYEEVGIHLCL